MIASLPQRFQAPSKSFVGDREKGLSGTPQRNRQPRRPLRHAFRLARAQSGSHPQACVHTLRHCYATHLLEEGVSLRLIAQYLGHASLDVTVIYTHLTATNEGQARAALDRLLP